MAFYFLFAFLPWNGKEFEFMGAVGIAVSAVTLSLSFFFAPLWDIQTCVCVSLKVTFMGLFPK
jgi:hypothetical protein